MGDPRRKPVVRGYSDSRYRAQGALLHASLQCSDGTYPRLSVVRGDGDADDPCMRSSGHHRLRKGRHSVSGQVYFVTTTTRGRSPLFADWDVAIVACRTNVHLLTWGDARLLCWVLMPDHWHGLVELGEQPLPLVVNRFKSRIAKAIRAEVDGSVHVWARSYHDRAVRREESLVDVARYIAMNPVRAGLVPRVGDYPYWHAAWL